MDNRTEQLADGVWRLEVATYINVVLIAHDGHGDAEGLTVVDTGVKSAGGALVRSIRMLGFDPRALRTVLLTHWHRDHTGSAAGLAASSARPRVYARAPDLEVVQGVVDPRATRPAATTRLGRALARVNRPGPAVPAAQPLRDGENLALAGGAEVVATPGHTPGHTAFWLPDRGVLLAGDAVFNVWRLGRGPRFLCSDLPAVPATVRRLAAYDADVVAMAHGPPLLGRTRQRLESLLDGDVD